MKIELSKKEEREARKWRIKKCGSPNFKDLFKEFDKEVENIGKQN